MATDFKLLSDFIQAESKAIDITNASPELIKEIQALLRINVDGIVGNITKKAFADFKEESSLEFPSGLGVTTAKKLLELEGKEETATNDSDSTGEGKPNQNAGNRTGKTMKLPNGDLVYENQYIVEGIPLTWGEATKGCDPDRVPTINEYVQNAVRLTKVWGKVREKFGSPLIITSGFRPEKANNKAGGVKNSQHLKFLALDMKPVNGEYRKLLDVLETSDFVGIGDAVFGRANLGFFHGDIRPTGGRIKFDYTKKK